MIRKFILFALALCGTFSMNAQKKYEIGNPNDPNAKYLDDYRPLKEYINYEKYPNFKLGIGTTVNDYLYNRNFTKEITEGYFTETVAGNAMKMSSCVDGNGNMNFSTVTNYVNTATEAGLNVYGHTLAWHSQQPNSWLRSLIKDKPAPKDENATSTDYVTVVVKDFTKSSDQNTGWTSDKNQFGFSITFSNTDGMKVHTTQKCTNPWDVQFLGVTGLSIDEGANYKVTMCVRATSAGSFHTKLGSWNDGVLAELPFTTEWQDVEVLYNNAKGGDFYMMQCGDFVGDIFVKSITIAKEESVTEVTEERRCIVVTAGEKKAETWDNQFWIVTGDFSANSSFEFSADVRADFAASASTQIHNAPGNYVHYEALGNAVFTTDWKTWKAKGTFTRAGSSIAFNLNDYAGANNYYFDNVSLKINGKEVIKNGDFEGEDISSFKVKYNSGAVVDVTISDKITYVKYPTPIPLTQEEKIEVLTGAMEKWIKGMMQACGGKVKAWDVVNEAISGGGNDGEGNYALQHANEYVPGGTTWDVGGDNFYWQDHMGDMAYVRTAVRLARKYYAEYGGKPEDLKLFINDYNLESDWDQNKKVKSLINWIKKWESDGETKIDGIGTQMHISCYMNENTNNSKKRAIENMFKLMAESGKLVRVSEMDMGMVDANGNNVPTANMTEEMHMKMADLYEWIIKKYLEIIPAEQQWGICQWCPTDSPSNSGWRANTPVGIWSLDYYRKHAYAGFVRGLGGVASDIEGIVEDTNSEESIIFDLNGKRVNNDFESLPSGLYIMKGRKVMKK